MGKFWSCCSLSHKLLKIFLIGKKLHHFCPPFLLSKVLSLKSLKYSILTINLIAPFPLITTSSCLCIHTCTKGTHTHTHTHNSEFTFVSSMCMVSGPTTLPGTINKKALLWEKLIEKWYITCNSLSRNGIPLNTRNHIFPIVLCVEIGSHKISTIPIKWYIVKFIVPIFYM